MENSQDLPRSSRSIDIPTDKLFNLVIDAVNKTIDLPGEVFMCGGTVRDLLLGKTPKDIDFVATVRDFDVLVAGFCSELEALQNDRCLNVTVKKPYVRTLTSGSVKGSRLLRIKLSLKTEGETADDHIELDFRELNFPGHENKPISSLLLDDVKTRDFKINSLYCSTRDKQVVDLLGGLKDLDQKLISGTSTAAAVFNDRRRMIRAVRLQFQHGLELERDISEFLRLKGIQELRYLREKYILIQEYDKAYSDIDCFAEIFSSLAKYGLILNAGIQMLPAANIKQAYATLAETGDPDDKLEKVFQKCKNFRQALTVTCLMVKLESPSHATSTNIENYVPFGKIFRNMISQSKKYRDAASGKSDYFVELQNIIHSEALLGHPKIKKFLSSMGWKQDGSSSQVDRANLEIRYKRVLDLSTDAFNSSLKSSASTFNNLFGMYDHQALNIGLADDFDWVDDIPFDNNLLKKLDDLSTKFKSTPLTMNVSDPAKDVLKKAVSLEEQNNLTINEKSEYVYMAESTILSSLPTPLDTTKIMQKIAKADESNDPITTMKKASSPNNIITSTQATENPTTPPIPKPLTPNPPTPNQPALQPIYQSELNPWPIADQPGISTTFKAADLLAEPRGMPGLDTQQTRQMVMALSTLGELSVSDIYDESKCVNAIVTLLLNKPIAPSKTDTATLVAMYCVDDARKEESERNVVRNRSDEYREYVMKIRRE